MKANKADVKVTHNLYIYIKKSAQFFLKHKELTLILFMGFILRYFLLDWNSYWLDELFSVYECGVIFDTHYEQFSYFREYAYPVPLYEFILFNWMILFGHTEIATRFLSTIFVTLATLLLYLFTLRIFGKRIAIASTLLFSLSYMAVYYSLEASYYGLILFLSVLSSYLFILYLESLGNDFSWKKFFCNRLFVMLTITNASLILTHTHTLFFIGVQGIFFLLYLVFFNGTKGIMLIFLKAVTVYLVQVLIVFSLWGFVIIEFVRRVLDNSFEAFSGRSFFLNQPQLVFFQYVVEPNLNLPLITYDQLAYLTSLLQRTGIIIFIAIFLFFVIIAVKYTGPIRQYYSVARPYYKIKIFIYYIILWLLLPSALAYLVYRFGYFDRFHARYIIFCTPPLMILTVVTLERLLSCLDYLAKRFLKRSFIRHYLRYATIYAIVLAVLLVVPGGLKGATERKADWRGITNHIIEQIHGDPGHSYIVLETTYSPYYTLLDYYFIRYSDHVRVYDTIQESVEIGLRRGEVFTPRFLEPESRKEIARHDFLIVSFHDLPVGRFPHTIELLSEEFTLTGKYLDHNGRGYLIFKVDSDGGASFNAFLLNKL